MAMLTLKVNGRRRTVEAGESTPLLWVLREGLRMTGTKYGCGMSLCGACTVHIDGRAERSCQVRAAEVQGKEITTIEGLPEDHPVKKVWIEEEVAQCGYCQPGQIMQCASLLAESPAPKEEEVLAGMEGNLCRCGTYFRIRRAIRRLVGSRP